MKNLNILSVGLLMCFALSTSAQVTQIFNSENNSSSDISSKILIQDDKLYIITNEGVYSQKLNEFGNLVEPDLQLNQLFEPFKYEIVNFLVSGDNVIISTKSAIHRSENGGESWEEICDFPASLKRGEINKPNEFFIISGLQIYYTSDFGKTWDKKGVVEGTYLKTHPFDSKISIAFTEMMVDVLDNKYCSISYDCGKTWESISSGFVYICDVAYHYTDSNKIVLIGMPIVASKDMGKTWEITKNWRSDNSQFVSNADFDTRGSDRLYGTRDNILLYSDDYGANWSEMCQVGENSLDYIENFVQREDKIYAITKEYKVYQIDLSQIETSVETIGVGNENVSVSVEGNNLRINSQSEISNIEIYSIGGIKLLSQKYATEGIDISDLLQGTYIARLQTADGRSLSVKFNK